MCVVFVKSRGGALVCVWVVPVSGHVCVAIDAGGIETVCVAAVDMSG